jgi:hypothetical protein
MARIIQASANRSLPKQFNYFVDQPNVNSNASTTELFTRVVGTQFIGAEFKNLRLR